MGKKKTVIQTHHIAYKPEWKVKIYQGEHWLLTQLQRRKKVSLGFIKSLKVWLALHENDAVELEKNVA